MLPLRGGLAPLTLASSVAVLRWLTGGIPAANCIAAYEPMDAATLATSYINAANPGVYDCTLGVAPIFEAGVGWGLTGTQYLRTGIVAGSTWSAIIRFTGATLTSRSLFGAARTAGQNNFYIAPYSDRVWYGYGREAGKTPQIASGVLAITPAKGWRNGTNEIAISSSAITTFPIMLGCLNLGGTPTALFVGKIQRAYFYDIDITSYMAGLTTAINS